MTCPFSRTGLGFAPTARTAPVDVLAEPRGPMSTRSAVTDHGPQRQHPCVSVCRVAGEMPESESLWECANQRADTWVVGGLYGRHVRLGVPTCMCTCAYLCVCAGELMPWTRFAAVNYMCDEYITACRRRIGRCVCGVMAYRLCCRPVSSSALSFALNQYSPRWVS